MAATGLQLNWAGVTVGATTMTKVTSVDFNPGNQLIKFAGDQDRYPTVITNNMNEPTVSITGGNVTQLRAYGPGAGPVTIVGILKDANSPGTGDLTWSASNCYFRTYNVSAQHGAYATATAHWDCASTDGSTPPFNLS